MVSGKATLKTWHAITLHSKRFAKVQSATHHHNVKLRGRTPA